MIKESNDNTLFTTGQCNNNCLMCCQPPKRVKDIEMLYKQNLKIIDKAPDDLTVIGISGGEPTLLGRRLFDLIDYIRVRLPDAVIHILSNGRNFQDANYVSELKRHAGNEMFIGIPLHSDYYFDHDIIAGAKNAYYETIQGLYNLAEYDIEIELRVVINALNYQRLPQMSEFIFKNLPFVDWVAFMAMEHTGHAVTNQRRIWVEPSDYILLLEKAVVAINDYNIEGIIYNIPLCLLPDKLHSFAAKSISDWKVNYLDLCDKCVKKCDCGGLFATSRTMFNGLKPILA